MEVAHSRQICLASIDTPQLGVVMAWAWLDTASKNFHGLGAGCAWSPIERRPLRPYLYTYAYVASCCRECVWGAIEGMTPSNFIVVLNVSYRSKSGYRTAREPTKMIDGPHYGDNLGLPCCECA